MVEVIVFAEGQSDEQFIKRVVAPALNPSGIFLKPRLMQTSNASAGGAINFERLWPYVRNTLRESQTTYITTFFDLYALDTGMPGLATVPEFGEPETKAAHVEAELHSALVKKLGFRPKRFMAHIQPYELEGLLFSNTDLLSQTVPAWAHAADDLRKVRQSFATPEHINGGVETSPSKRLGKMLKPSYQKTAHAPAIGLKIGLSAIMAECPHFAAWVERLRQLQPL